MLLPDAKSSSFFAECISVAGEKKDGKLDSEASGNIIKCKDGA